MASIRSIMEGIEEKDIQKDSEQKTYIGTLNLKYITSQLNSRLVARFPTNSLLPYCILPLLSNDLSAMIAFTKTCKYFYLAFQPSLREALDVRLKPLLQAVVYGNPHEVENRIKVNRSLLFYSGTVEDYSGRTIEGTALRMALGAEDVSRLEHKGEGMAEMIESYLVQLPNGKQEIIKQKKKQFDKNYLATEEKNAQEDLEALHQIVNAIEHAGPGHIIENAKQELIISPELDLELKKFRKYLDIKLHHVVSTGKHFNTQILVAALDLYNKKYEIFGGYNSNKNNLFFRQVIGYIQRFLPACVAQAFCQSLYLVEESNKPLKRKLTFLNGPAYYPLDSNPLLRLGYNFAGGVMGGVMHVERKASMFHPSFFQKLSKAKAEAMQQYMPSKPYKCLVM